MEKAGNWGVGEVDPWDVWARSWRAGWALWQRCLLAPWSMGAPLPGSGIEEGAGAFFPFDLKGAPFSFPFSLPNLAGSLTPLSEGAWPEGLASPQRLSFRLALPGWWGQAPETYRVEAVVVREVEPTPQVLPASPTRPSLPKPSRKAPVAPKRSKKPVA